MLDRLSSFAFRNYSTTVAAPPGMTVLGAIERVMDALRSDPTLAESVLPLQQSLLLTSVSVDVLVNILSFVGNYDDLIAVERTCGGMRKLLRTSEAVWQATASRAYPLWFSNAMVSGLPAPSPRGPAPPLGVATMRVAFERKRWCERHWMSHRPRQHVQLDFSRGIHTIIANRDELYIGSGLTHEIVAFDIRRGRVRGVGLVGHMDVATSMQFGAPGTSLLFSASHDGTVRSWDRTILAQQTVFAGHEGKVWCLDVTADRLFSGSGDRTVRIWAADSGKQLHVIQDHRTTISALRVMQGSNGSVLATGSAGNTIRIYNVTETTAQCTTRLRGHQKGVFGIHMTHSFLISASLDNTLKLWDWRQENALLATLVECDRNGMSLEETAPDSNTRGYVTLAADDTKAIVGGPAREIHIWDFRMRRLVDKITGHSHWVTGLAIIDDETLVSCSRDKSIRILSMTASDRHSHIARDALLSPTPQLPLQ